MADWRTPRRHLPPVVRGIHHHAAAIYLVAVDLVDDADHGVRVPTGVDSESGPVAELRGRGAGHAVSPLRLEYRRGGDEHHDPAPPGLVTGGVCVCTLAVPGPQPPVPGLPGNTHGAGPGDIDSQLPDRQ